MGRPVVSLPTLPYGRQSIDQDDISEVVRVLEGDWLTQGPDVAEFERALAEYTGAKYAVAVSSGTAGLHIACMAAGVGAGDSGITSPITFVASANCIAYCGGRPRFADVDPTTVTLDVERLEDECRREAPKVIIPVDFAGQPADLPAIQRVARQYGALVIEDAAHSLGGSYTVDGQQFRAGSCAHADMAVLSFHPVKHITSGEGGAVLTNSAELYRALQDARSHGITRDADRLEANEGPWYYEQQNLGFNYRITDVQCALGASQLRKLDRFVARRRELVDLYVQHLGSSDDLDLLIETGERFSAYHILVARLKGGAGVRRRLFTALAADGIRAQVHYIPVHLQPWYRREYGFSAGDFPHAESYYQGAITLPLFPRMQDADVTRVAQSVLRVLDREVAASGAAPASVAGAI